MPKNPVPSTRSITSANACTHNSVHYWYWSCFKASVITGLTPLFSSVHLTNSLDQTRFAQRTQMSFSSCGKMTPHYNSEEEQPKRKGAGVGEKIRTYKSRVLDMRRCRTAQGQWAGLLPLSTTIKRVNFHNTWLRWLLSPMCKTIRVLCYTLALVDDA